MPKYSIAKQTFLYLFIITLIISLLLYGYGYFFNKSTPTGLRIFFTLLSMSILSLELFCGINAISSHKIMAITAILLAPISFSINLYATWNPSFLASFWLFTEIFIALAALSAGVATGIKLFSTSPSS